MNEHEKQVEELAKELGNDNYARLYAKLVIKLGYSKSPQTMPAVSPHQLYDTAKGDAEKYKELMLAHGYLIHKMPEVKWPEPYNPNTTGLWRERYDGWNLAIEACRKAVEDNEVNIKDVNKFDKGMKALKEFNEKEYGKETIKNYSKESQPSGLVPFSAKTEYSIAWVLAGLINDYCGMAKNADDAINREKLRDIAIDKINKIVGTPKGLVALDEDKSLVIFKDKYLCPQVMGQWDRHVYTLSPESFNNLFIQNFGANQITEDEIKRIPIKFVTCGGQGIPTQYFLNDESAKAICAKIREGK